MSRHIDFRFPGDKQRARWKNKILMERAIIREAICLGREEKRFKEEDILFGNSKSYLRLIGKRKEV